MPRVVWVRFNGAAANRHVRLRAGDTVLLAEVRQEFAKRYLERGTLTASEVGYLIGFAEPPAFFKAFKRWTGLTPREFQERG